MHQEGNCGVLGIIRYILNKTDYKDKIEDGELYNIKLFEDYENKYKDYIKIYLIICQNILFQCLKIMI